MIEENKLSSAKKHKIKRESAGAELVQAPFSFEKDKTMPVASEIVQIDIDEVLEEIENQEAYPLSEENERSKIDSAEMLVTKQKSKKKKWLSLAFMLVNVIVVVAIMFFQLKTDNVVSLRDVFSTGINWWFFILCFLMFGLMSVGEGLKINVFIKKMTKRSRPFLSYKTGAIGRYYDCITPLSTGGQPFQVFYLKNRGLKGSEAVSAPLGKYVFFQIVHVLFCTIVIFSTLINPSVVGEGTSGTVVSVASWVGYILNFSLIFIIIFISLNRKAGTKFIGSFLKLFSKMKLIKNYDKTYGSLMKGVDDFQTTIKYYIKSPKTFITSFLLASASIIINYTIPFFIYCTFAGYNPAMWSDILVKCAMIDMAASFIPLPGGTGVSELSFTALFASLFVGGKLFWAMLLWRILTYYGYIIQGILLIVYDFFFGNKKYEWQKKKWALETESEQFKSDQLNIFKSKQKKKK